MTSTTNYQNIAYLLTNSASIWGELKGECDRPGLALETGIQEAKGLLVQTSITIVKAKH
jgi:hypothetical protein